MRNNKRHFLPTYEEAVLMTEKAAFYENKYVVEGYNVSVFNYRLAQYTDFANPLRHRDKTGHEMRGLTFVFNEDGSVFKTYRMLQKFFNINQTEESLHSKIKDLKIKSVYEKEDGSILSYIKLPNGKVVAKSKMSFESEQAIRGNKLYEKYKEAIDHYLDNNIVPIFEYVAPFNRIVLRYSEEKLILLRLRDNITGKYVEIEENNLYNLEVPKKYVFNNIDEIIELCLTEENKEGYVINLIDNNGFDLFVKEKTEWYRQRHGLLTDDIYKENIIIKYILDDTIDDVVSEIPEDEVEIKENINEMIAFIRDEISDVENDMKSEIELFKQMGSNKKEYALKYRRNPYFYCVMFYANNNNIDIYQLAIDAIRKKTDKLEKAREFISSKRPELLVDKTF